MPTPLNTLRPGSPASRHFDLLRGLAAVYVMIFHLRPQLFVTSESAGDAAAIKALYLFTSLGYLLVAAFFVISGYLITSSILRSIQTNGWSWFHYLSSRLIRLWIVLLPALLLTYVWDSLSMAFFRTDGFFAGSLDWGTFWGNLFFLQQIQADNFGRNIPLWSLSYEFWYYMLFPCLIQIVFANTRWKKAIYLVLTAAIGYFVGMTILAYFAIWLLGSLLAVVPLVKVRSRRIRLLLLAGSVLILAAALLIGKLSDPYHQLGRLESFPLYFGVGLAFAVLLYFILIFYNVHERVTPLRRDKGFSRWLARISYSLYLTHWPVLLFCTYGFGYQTWQPDLLHLGYGAALAGGLILYAWLVASVTEAYLPSIKAKLFKLRPRPGGKPQGTKPEQGRHDAAPKGGV
ncbi:acyltransferase family protein [Cohnella fermenti]|uniref:Acyltransferase n=1 Tax=Cohnella fermenti TaxID=2565925 RepID=A0A4S4BJQ0_9BACL|nr:acyltransferase [Cohnella fermenti]THF74902.1 acyltransferase [Cohnella fermenti]